MPAMGLCIHRPPELLPDPEKSIMSHGWIPNSSQSTVLVSRAQREGVDGIIHMHLALLLLSGLLGPQHTNLSAAAVKAQFPKGILWGLERKRKTWLLHLWPLTH